ncbi:MAG TPA: hypothetical protein H9687_07740 [Firmicutes bacterium]|nr:hypothetical protein [Bacillota bacterium]
MDYIFWVSEVLDMMVGSFGRASVALLCLRLFVGVLSSVGKRQKTYSQAMKSMGFLGGTWI